MKIEKEAPRMSELGAPEKGKEGHFVGVNFLSLFLTDIVVSNILNIFSFFFSRK